MPKNLGAYNNDLSIPRKKDVDKVAEDVAKKVNKSGDTMSGKLYAQSNNDYTTGQVRNVIFSTEDPSGGNPGDIWIKYSV